MIITPSSVVRCRIVWIAVSDIAVIRKVKNRYTFIFCCQPVVKCSGSYLQKNNYLFFNTPVSVIRF